jgi:putative SOS response-associated peptidase YedK
VKTLMFAALWDWRNVELGDVLHITTTPNTLLKSIHNTMPVKMGDQWLDPQVLKSAFLSF